MNTHGQRWSGWLTSVKCVAAPHLIFELSHKLVEIASRGKERQATECGTSARPKHLEDVTDAWTGRSAVCAGVKHAVKLQISKAGDIHVSGVP